MQEFTLLNSDGSTIPSILRFTSNSFRILYLKHREFGVVISCQVIKLFVNGVSVVTEILTDIFILHLLLQVLDVTDCCSTKSRPWMSLEIKI
jgi:hypothetical protein